MSESRTNVPAWARCARHATGVDEITEELDRGEISVEEVKFGLLHLQLSVDGLAETVEALELHQAVHA